MPVFCECIVDFPKTLAATTDAAYQRMVDLMRVAFPEKKLLPMKSQTLIVPVPLT